MGIRKNDTPHHIVRAFFRSLIGEKYAGHKLIFMDGYKNEEGLEAAAMLGRNKIVASLPHVATVFTAEVVGLKLAAKLLEGYSSAEKFLVYLVALQCALWCSSECAAGDEGMS